MISGADDVARGWWFGSGTQYVDDLMKNKKVEAAIDKALHYLGES